MPTVRRPIRMRSKALLLVVLLTACGGAPPASTTPSSSPPLAVGPGDARASIGARLRNVDPRRGLVVVAHLEDASDGEAPPMIVSGHRCAPAEIAEVADLLGTYVAQRASMDEPIDWHCSGDRCELRGMMEYDPTRVLRFDRDASGALVVVGVDLFEDVGSGPEYVAEVRRAVDRDHAALRAACP